MARLKLPLKLESWLKGKFIKVELTLFVIAFSGYITHIPPIIGLSLSALAIWYFISSQFRYQDATKFNQVISGAAPIVWSINVLGIMFWSLKLEGYQFQIEIAKTSIYVLLFLYLVEFIITKKFTRRVELIRTLILFTISLLISLTFKEITNV